MTEDLPQNLWREKGSQYRLQIRRAQIVHRYLQEHGAEAVLDVGCAEGFMTSMISDCHQQLVGIDLHQASLGEARRNVKRSDFVRASITNLPFTEGSFDAVCLLEILEHLPSNVQQAGVEEIDRVLRPRGIVVVSVPYRQEIRFIEQAGSLVPDNKAGHIHSFDESGVCALMPTGYARKRSQTLGAFPLVDCSRPLSMLPLDLWLPLNNIAGGLRKSHFLVMMFIKPT